MFSTGTLQLSLTAWNQRLWSGRNHHHPWHNYLLLEGDYWPLWGLLGLSCITASADGKMGFGLFGFTSLGPALPCSGSCTHLWAGPGPAGAQGARGGNSLPSSAAEGKTFREEFHSLKTRLELILLKPLNVAVVLHPSQGQQTFHMITGNFSIGLLPSGCSVVNALSATFALKGKALAL